MLFRMLKYVWASPTTLVGLLGVVATVITGGRVQIVSGAIEAWGGFSAWLFRHVLRGSLAITIGHVILALDEEGLGRYRRHEHIHVEQYEKWGPLLVPLYFGASLMAWLRGKHYYYDNVFEQEAYSRAPRN
ncbi:MAG: hypothetical protein HY300_12565 [Verrucomicrobia bacterium]|nr:hypothetical protein [Verrucomicrobiota bacterium]